MAAPTQPLPPTRLDDFARSKAFYDRALAPLGVKIIEAGKSRSYGHDDVDFWIGEGPASFQQPSQLRVIRPVHVAFAARSHAEVDAFHTEALAAGGRDFGAPGLRPEYHEHYYGAFVLDLTAHLLAENAVLREQRVVRHRPRNPTCGDCIHRAPTSRCMDAASRAQPD